MPELRFELLYAAPSAASPPWPPPPPTREYLNAPRAPDPVGSGFLGSLTAGALLSPITDVVVDLGASAPSINSRVEAVAAPMFSLGITVDVG